LIANEHKNTHIGNDIVENSCQLIKFEAPFRQ